MDDIHNLLEIAKDFLEIVILVLSLKNLIKPKKSKKSKKKNK
jgi:hypothetical protein